jgi:hypothetical protein
MHFCKISTFDVSIINNYEKSIILFFIFSFKFTFCPIRNINTYAGNGSAGYSGDGGVAKASELDAPDYVYVDGGGNIYIVEENDNRLRVVSPSTNIINTIAGNSAMGFGGDGGPAITAEFNWTSGVVTDSSGNIYIADKDNERIRKITAQISTGIFHSDVREEISIYPNPANNQIFVELNNIGEIQLIVYTITGGEVRKSNEINTKEFVIPIANLVPGFTF